MIRTAIEVRHESYETIGRACFDVAHEINNLLSVVTGYSDLLLHQGTVNGRDELEQISFAAERASELARQMLHLSRSEREAPARFDLSRLVQRITPMLRLIGGKNASTRVYCRDVPLPILVHRGDVEQIALNLVTNARDALDGAGAILFETMEKVHHSDVSHLLGLAPAGRYCVLRVSDSGKGMTRDEQARLFEPFYTTKSSDHGTGLGMSIVKNLLVRANGFARLESEIGRGTAFEIYWPWHDG